MSLAAYLVLSGILFAIGAAIVLVRRSAVISLMGVELMLNSANLAFVTFARIHGNVSGEIMAFFVMVVAAAEVVVGLAIVVSIFKSRVTTNVDDIDTFRHRGTGRSSWPAYGNHFLGMAHDCDPRRFQCASPCMRTPL